MGKPIAVQGCTIIINGGVISSPAPLVPKTPPDSNILASNKPAYFGDIQVIVPSGTSACDYYYKSNRYERKECFRTCSSYGR